MSDFRSNTNSPLKQLTSDKCLHDGDIMLSFIAFVAIMTTKASLAPYKLPVKGLGVAYIQTIPFAKDPCNCFQFTLGTIDLKVVFAFI